MFNKLPDELIQLIYEFDGTYRTQYRKCMKEIEWRKMEEEMKKMYPPIYNYTRTETANSLYTLFREEKCSNEGCSHQNSFTNQSFVLPFVYYDTEEKKEETGNICKDCYMKTPIKIVGY